MKKRSLFFRKLNIDYFMMTGGHSGVDLAISQTYLYTYETTETTVVAGNSLLLL